MDCAITVIIPAHNPHDGRLRRTLAALRDQTLPADRWECLLVDNASRPPLRLEPWSATGPSGLRVVVESQLGLSAARRRGFLSAQGDIAVMVDDDNVLAPDYLAQVIELFAAHPRVGLAGGRSLPEFETAPPTWAEEFLPLLALRDLGEAPLISSGLRPPGSERNTYPPFAPIGAGMALRRAAWEAWLGAQGNGALSDRRGTELTSSGDNDIVMSAMAAGWEAAYFPGLRLTHLIPPGRLEADYLARLNRGIQKSWLQMLRRHEACPWPPLSPFGARFRQARAWFTQRAWSSPAARIRWQGACGHFEGRVTLG